LAHGQGKALVAITALAGGAAGVVRLAANGRHFVCAAVGARGDCAAVYVQSAVIQQSRDGRLALHPVVAVERDVALAVLALIVQVQRSPCVSVLNTGAYAPISVKESRCAVGGELCREG